MPRNHARDRMDYYLEWIESEYRASHAKNESPSKEDEFHRRFDRVKSITQLFTFLFPPSLSCPGCSTYRVRKGGFSRKGGEIFLDERGRRVSMQKI